MNERIRPHLVDDLHGSVVACIEQEVGDEDAQEKGGDAGLEDGAQNEKQQIHAVDEIHQDHASAVQDALAMLDSSLD